MDAYKLRNIVVSLQGGKHCFAETRGCLLEDGRTLVGRREDACRLIGGCLSETGRRLSVDGRVLVGDGQALVGRREEVWLLTGRCLLEGRSGAW